MSDFPVVVLLIGEFSILQALRRAVLRYRLLDVMRGAVLCEHQQVLFVGFVSDARYRPDLRVAQCALGESLVDLRQLRQRVGYSYLFPGCVHADAALEIEPVRTRAQALLCPVFLFVEFANERQQA